MENQTPDHRGCPIGGATTPQRHGGAIGNPPHIPTQADRERVRTYAKVMSQPMIAASFEPPISIDTLTRHYRAELDAGQREAVATVGAKLLAKALSGNLTAMIFYLRTRGGWATQHQVTGPGGGPLQTIDLTAFLADKSEEELANFEQFLSALATAGGIDIPSLLGVGAPASEGAPASPGT